MSDKVPPEWVSEFLPAELVDSTLFKFTVTLRKVDGQTPIAQVDMLTTADLDYENLEKQMFDLPSQFSFWAAMYSEAKLAVGLAERRLKARRGSCLKQVMDASSSSGFKMTGENAKAVVESMPTIIEADVKLLDAQMKAGKLYYMLEAMKIKAELGRSLLGVKKQDREASM